MKQNRLTPHRGDALNEASGAGTDTRVVTVRPESPSRSTWTRKPTIAIAALLITSGAVSAWLNLGGEATHVPAPIPPEQSMSRAEMLRDWVNRGLVPDQALPEAEPISRDDLLRDWVNRGLVPGPALD